MTKEEEYDELTCYSVTHEAFRYDDSNGRTIKRYYSKEGAKEFFKKLCDDYANKLQVEEDSEYYKEYFDGGKWSYKVKLKEDIIKIYK